MVNNKYSIAKNFNGTISIHVDGINLIMDSDDKTMDLFLNPPRCKFKKPIWRFAHDDDESISHVFTYDTNLNKIYLANLLKSKKQLNDNKITYVNGNCCDYRRDNIIIGNTLLEELENIIKENDDIVSMEFEHFHTKSVGKSAGKIRNPIWKIQENISGKVETYYLMFCETHHFTKVSEECFDKLININDKVPTWYCLKNGYIGTHTNDTIVYLHQYIMNHMGHGKGQNSIDHINRDKLDNRRLNLRIVSQSEQNKNTGKRNRKSNAQPLPHNITNLPKYVTYNREKITTKTHTYHREFFRIEKHPNLHLLNNGKSWSSSKSTNVSLEDKLKQAIDMVNMLDNMTQKTITTVKRDLPKHVALSRRKRKDNVEISLCYDRRIDGIRQNLKMKISSDNPTDEELERFMMKIKMKYC